MSDKISPFDAIFTEGAGRDPMVAAQASARANLPKRFWKTVTLDQRDDGFHVLLDNRPAKTPGRNALASRHKLVAERIMQEWNGVEDVLDPAMLPMTKLVNVAIDMEPGGRDALLDEVQAYAGTDLLCYRADRPQGLVDRQSTVWDPYLDRLHTHHSIRLQLAAGIMHVAQDPEQLAAIRALASARLGCLESLVALNLVISLTGSAVLALALTEPGVDDGRAKTIWQAAHVDEDWNRALWGEDADATALRDAKWVDFEAAAFVLSKTRC